MTDVAAGLFLVMATVSFLVVLYQRDWLRVANLRIRQLVADEQVQQWEIKKLRGQLAEAHEARRELQDMNEQEQRTNARLCNELSQARRERDELRRINNVLREDRGDFSEEDAIVAQAWLGEQPQLGALPTTAALVKER